MTKRYIDPACGLCHGTGTSVGHAGTIKPHDCPRCAGYGEFATPEAKKHRAELEKKQEVKP